jgi:adenosylcobinamide-phosphate synthase
VNPHPFIASTVLAADMLLGPLRLRAGLPPGPPLAAARLAIALGRRLDRPGRGPKTLFIRGALLVLVLVGSAGAIGVGLESLAARLPFGMLVDFLVLWGCIRPYRPLERLRAGARQCDLAVGVAPGRGLLDQAATSFVYFLVAPLFWYLVAGLPGLLIAAACWGVDRAATQSGARSADFGAVAHNLEAAIAWVPSRIAELIIVAATMIVPRGRPRAALLEAWAPARPDAARPAAALTGGLGIGGLPRIAGGDGPVRRPDLLRAMWLYVGALLIVAGILAMLAAV